MAGVPNRFSNLFQISSPQIGPIFAVSVDTDANADWFIKHAFKVNLHDTYGNPVVSVPGIKEILYTLQFENKIAPNQTDLANLAPTIEVGRSITYWRTF